MHIFNSLFSRVRPVLTQDDFDFEVAGNRFISFLNFFKNLILGAVSIYGAYLLLQGIITFTGEISSQRHDATSIWHGIMQIIGGFLVMSAGGILMYITNQS